MTDPDKLFQKADALLGRYRGESRASAQPDFPVLTEIVELHPLESREHVASGPGAPSFTLSADDLRELEARVLARISEVAPSMLEEVIPQAERDRMTGMLDRALLEIAEAARRDLESRLATLVSRALETAIIELREARERELR